MRRRLLGCLLVLAAACRGPAPAPSPAPPSPAPSPSAAAPDPFEAWLMRGLPVADGFDFAVGDADGGGSYTDPRTGRTHEGWYVATHFAEVYRLGIHPGEDWNGRGGGNTDLGQAVHAIGNGRVVYAAHCGALWGNVIMIDHVFYENHEPRVIRSAYVHLLDLRVRAGQDVRRRQVIAVVGRDPDGLYPAHLHLELRWDRSLGPTFWPSNHGHDVPWVREKYADPRAFIAAHRRLVVPQEEPALLLVSTQARRLRFYRSGRLEGEYEVGFGQEPGRKRRSGDNRTPLGMYFVIEKSRGPFPGPYGGFFGGHWIKVNYPNAFDAAWGESEGLLTRAQARGIAADWSRREPTWQGSPLGNGIGFHGWASPWRLEGPRRLSWGCVVLQTTDIARLYDAVPRGAVAVFF